MTQEERRPVFVVFEGLDGCGKSTVARGVATETEAVYMTTPTESVREYRDDLLASLGESQEARQLFYLATVFAASKEVEAHLAAGRSVVLDRYFLSTQAYAAFRGSVLQIDDIQSHLRAADVTFLLEAPLDVRRARMSSRGVGSAADRETMLPEADAVLRQAHRARSNLPVLGRLVTLDTARLCGDEVVARVLDELGRLRPGQEGGDPCASYR